jgi:hypothetical protein
MWVNLGDAGGWDVRGALLAEARMIRRIREQL